MKVLSLILLFLVLVVSGSISYVGLLGGLMPGLPIVAGVFFGLFFGLWLGFVEKVYFNKVVNFIGRSIGAMVAAYSTAFVLMMPYVNIFNSTPIPLSAPYRAFLIAGGLGAFLLVWFVHKRITKLSSISIMIVVLTGILAAIPFTKMMYSHNFWWLNNPFIFWQISVGMILGFLIVIGKRNIDIVTSSVTS